MKRSRQQKWPRMNDQKSSQSTPHAPGLTMGEVLGLKPERKLTAAAQAAYNEAINGTSTQEHTRMKAKTPKTPKTPAKPKTPKSGPQAHKAHIAARNAPAIEAHVADIAAEQAAKTALHQADGLTVTVTTGEQVEAAFTIRADAISYASDHHRPRVRIITPTQSYYKLVPGVRTATRSEALERARAYREQIIATGELPAPSDRPRTYGQPGQAKAPEAAVKIAGAQGKPVTVTKRMPGVTRVDVD